MHLVVITMSSHSIAHNTKRLNDLNRDFEILLNCTSYDDNVKKLLVQKIIKEIQSSLLKKLFKVLFILAFVVLQIHMIPFLNWNVSAIGRIVMIKMLKIWDWRYMYTTDCLIERNVKSTYEYNHETINDPYDDCIFCENIEEIHHVWNISYADLKSNYPNRGHPVVIKETQFVSRYSDWHDYVTTIQNLSKLIDSSPCNLQTNLFTEFESKNLNLLMELAKTSSEGWFFHFRNCDFEAVKQSRLLEEPPNFFSTHLKPFSSSWILMSIAYKVKKPKKILLKQTVIVKQIIGSLDVLIEPRPGCIDTCKDYLIRLEVGYTMVFSTEHWDFYYFPSSEGVSVTYLREYEMKI